VGGIIPESWATCSGIATVFNRDVVTCLKACRVEVLMKRRHAEGQILLTKPTTGIAGCCALGVTGHATAEPPSSV
jgi:hypothetical protein